MKLCKDCKWSTDLGGTPRHPDSKWGCSNEKTGSYTDVVDGRRLYIDCRVARYENAQCAVDGKLWEPKS